MGMIVSVPIPRCCIGVTSMGKGSDLLASTSQSSGYVIMLTLRLSCHNVSELLQC